MMKVQYLVYNKAGKVMYNDFNEDYANELIARNGKRYGWYLVRKEHEVKEVKLADWEYMGYHADPNKVKWDHEGKGEEVVG